MIKVGDKIPAVRLKILGNGGLEDVHTADLFRGRKVIMFSLPGAYTPVCSAEHLPGYIERSGQLRAKGIDEIVCLSVNDPWVMKVWGEQLGATGKVTMLPDGNGEFTKALGLEEDKSAAGLGIRGKRASLIVEDGVVKEINVEQGKGVSVSGADACLLKLG
jgi:peroxiredoxin